MHQRRSLLHHAQAELCRRFRRALGAAARLSSQFGLSETGNTVWAAPRDAEGLARLRNPVAAGRPTESPVTIRPLRISIHT